MSLLYTCIGHTHVIASNVYDDGGGGAGVVGVARVVVVVMEVTMVVCTVVTVVGMGTVVVLVMW